MTVETEIYEISIEQLRESPFNPRKTFLDIDALAQDIKSDGRVLQPLLVRDVTGTVGSDYEIVFGHRRYRAAQLAGLASVPCMVRNMSDEEARRAQIRENLQRNDVHPIEEAEGFAALMREHGVTAEQIVEQTGRSKSYVYGRLKLLQAVPKVREACLAGKIGADSALLVARLRTAKLQEQALAAIDRLYRADLEDGGKASYRAIRDLLAEKFTLDLKGAIFSTEAAELVADAGACTTCTKRTGNAPEYSDLVVEPVVLGHYPRRTTSADICTDPDCFESKKKAHLKLRAAELEAKGKTVIAGGKARSIVSADGGIKGGYVKLADVRDALKKAKGEKPATAIVQNPRDGKTVEVVKVEDLKATGVKVKEPDASNHRENYAEQQRKWEQEQAERARKVRIEQAVRTAVFAETLDAMAGQARNAFDLRVLAAFAWDGVRHEAREFMGGRLGIKVARFGNDDKPVLDAIDQMDPARLTLFCLECALVNDVLEVHQKPDALFAAAAHYGVNPAAIRKRGDEADAREVKPAAKVTKKAPTKKAAKAAATEAAEQ